LRHTDWAIFDGTQARIEMLVVRTALGGADDFIRRGRGAVAEWIVRQALRLCPYDERLYRMLLRATDAQGSRAGLRRAMAHVRTLAGEQDDTSPRSAPGGSRRDTTDCLHPETTALYHDLLHGLPAAGGAPIRL
jgi:hypothetical protein